MKKVFILFIISITFALQSKAQDILITREGNEKTVYELAISTNDIFYKLENKEDALIQKMSKKDVFMIKYSNGKKELFNTSESATSKTELSNNSTNNTTVSELENHPIVIKDEDLTPIKYIEKPTQKKANRFFTICQLKDGSIIEDDNIKAEYKITQSFIQFSNTLQTTLKNKTNRVLYIDLGNTFIMRGGEATPYYIPSSTSKETGSSKGGSVNLGGIGNALGVGGAAGGILNGVNVGGGTSKSSSTTIYAQRIIAIPPKSEKALEDQMIFPVGCGKLYHDSIISEEVNLLIGRDSRNIPARLVNSNNIKEGESLIRNENNTPIHFSSYITYSLDENCTETFPLKADFFAKQIIGYRTSKWMGDNFDKMLSPDWKDRCFLILWNSN